MIKIALADLFVQLPLDQLKGRQSGESPDTTFSDLLQQLSLDQPEKYMQSQENMSVQLLSQMQEDKLPPEFKLNDLLQDITAKWIEEQEELGSDVEDIEESLAATLMQADIKPYLSVGTETEPMPQELVNDRIGEPPMTVNLDLSLSRDHNEITEMLVADYKLPEAFTVSKLEAIGTSQAEISSLPADEMVVIPQTPRQPQETDLPEAVRFVSRDIPSKLEPEHVLTNNDMLIQTNTIRTNYQVSTNFVHDNESQLVLATNSQLGNEPIKPQDELVQVEQPETEVSTSKMVTLESVEALSEQVAPNGWLQPVTPSNEREVPDLERDITIVLEPLLTQEQQASENEHVVNTSYHVDARQGGVVIEPKVSVDDAPETVLEQAENIAPPDSIGVVSQMANLSEDSLADGDMGSSTNDYEKEPFQSNRKNEAQDQVFAQYVSSAIFAPEAEEVSFKSKPSAENVFEQIVEQMSFDARQDVQEVTIHLKPDYLGDVRIKLTAESGIINAEFVIGNDTVREVITQSIPQLRIQLESLGMNLGHVNVNVGDHHQQRRQDNFARQQFNQRFCKTGAHSLPVIGDFVVHNDAHLQINLRI